MYIAYITAKTPYGNGEQFILPEILEQINRGNKVIIIPVRPNNNLGKGEKPLKVSKYTIHMPLVNLTLLIKGLAIFFKHPVTVMGIMYRVLEFSGSIKKIFKNLAVFPKGLIVGDIVKKKGIEHIHAHWASTPSTIAYIAAEISGIPWSFTAHRWDIVENNMLNEKVRSAKFARVINKKGYYELISYIDDNLKHKCHILHVGIKIKPVIPKANKKNEYFTIITPANLVEVKGHVFLIRAIKKIVEKGYFIKCYFYGEGPLEKN